MSEPTPHEIYDSAVREGRRRLDMSGLELASTGFIAGLTVMFGVTLLAVITAGSESFVGPEFAELLGGLGFAVGLVFVVIGRTELFSENFFGPVAAVLEDDGRRWLGVLRLWATVLALNLTGGALLSLVLSIDGTLPDGSAESLALVAREIASKPVMATLSRAVLAGAVLSLLSYLLHAVDGAAARIAVTFMVGYFVAVGPFDHVVVNFVHLLFGIIDANAVTTSDLVVDVAVCAVGNVAGGVVLMTFTHTAQARGEHAPRRASTTRLGRRRS